MFDLILAVHGCIDAELSVGRGLSPQPYPWSVHRLSCPAANRRDCIFLVELSIVWGGVTLNQMVVLFLEN